MKAVIRICFLTIVALSFSIISNQAQADSSISNSELSSLRLLIPSGEKLDISNSKLCLNPNAACVLVLESGAKLEGFNSTLGSGLIIYSQDAFNQSMHLSSCDVQAKIEQVGNIEGRASAYLEQEQDQDDSLSNTSLESLKVAVAAQHKYEVSNGDLCIQDLGTPCQIMIGSGAALEFFNTKLGSRLVMQLQDDYLTHLEFSSVKFYGKMQARSCNLAAPLKAQTITAPTDRELVAKLRENKIEADQSDRGVVIRLPDVFFDFNKASLTAGALTNVEHIAQIVAPLSSRMLSIEGHTDAIGSDSYNLELSKQRANSVAYALEKLGITKQRISTEGYGKQRPVSDNESELGRAKNRRVEVVLLKEGVTGSTSSLTDQLNGSSRAQPVAHQKNKLDSQIGSDKDSDKEADLKFMQKHMSNLHIHLDNQGVHVKAPDGTVSLGEDGVHIDAGSGE